MATTFDFPPRLLKATPLFLQPGRLFLRGFHFFLYSNKAYWHISSYLQIITTAGTIRKFCPSPHLYSYQQRDMLNVDSYLKIIIAYLYAFDYE